MSTLRSTNGAGSSAEGGGDRARSCWGGGLAGFTSGQGIGGGWEFGRDSMKEYSAVSLKEGRRWELDTSRCLAERGSEELRLDDRGIAAACAETGIPVVVSASPSESASCNTIGAGEAKTRGGEGVRARSGGGVEGGEGHTVALWDRSSAGEGDGGGEGSGGGTEV